MHPRLLELHQDHVNLSKVLHLLEALLADVKDGKHIDLAALSEIVDYVQSYPDTIHHRREDVIFSAYLRHGGRHGGTVERLSGEHALLYRQTHDLHDHIDQWCQDSPVSREKVVAVIADYLKLQWDHLNLEESEAFGLLDRELTAEDWQGIEATMPSSADPLFGEPMRQRFANLLDRLFGE